MKLYPAKLGMAAGVIWGGLLFIMTLISVATQSVENVGYGKMFLDIMVSVYPGYSITVGGSIIALVYGFIDAFIGFALLAWLYNAFCKCCHRCEK